MSAYRKGLTGVAAAWAVRKQKQHRAINQRVMMAIDVLMNPTAPVAGLPKPLKSQDSAICRRNIDR